MAGARLLLAVAALGVAARANTLRCGRCEGGDSLSCPSSFELQYTVEHLPHQDPTSTSLVLTCDFQTVDIDFSLVEGCSFPNVVFVKIQHCPLFNESIATVLRKIGVDPQRVDFLFWDHSHSIENGLQSWHLDGLSNLTAIQVQGNRFKSFPEFFLKGNPQLKKIYITGNEVKQLPNDFLSYTPNVRILDLGNNHIEYIVEKFLENVTLLETFIFQSNKLSHIPDGLFSHTPSLNSLVLRYNAIQEMSSSSLQNLPNLKYLDLRVNNLKTLHKNTFKGCYNLSTIFLDYNEIESLPFDLFQDTSVEVLNLGKNKITNVNFLANIPTLQNISLFSNEITTLQRSIFEHTPNVVKLDLQLNNIQSIEKGALENLRKMQVVLLNSNRLNDLPDNLFRNCAALSRVFLQRNNISTIPHRTFPAYPNIKKIDLSFNQLSFKRTFSNPLNSLTGLEEIYLSNNKISTVFNEALLIFTKLKVLDLRNNLLSFLDDRQLSFISKNVTLHLENNNISSIMTTKNIGYGNFEEKILSLFISGNPIVCDCQIHSFLKTAHFNKPFVLADKLNILVEDAEITNCVESYSSNQLSLVDVDFTKVVCDYDCSEICGCKIRLEDRMILINCSSSSLDRAPSFTEQFNKMRKGYKLSIDLSGNHYEGISFLNSRIFENLKHLNLANNSVSFLNHTNLPTSISSLDLRSNNFSSLPLELVKHLNSSGMTLYLSDNPWLCDCELLDFHAFLRENYEQVADRSSVVCAGGEGWRPVEELTTDELCPLLHRPAVIASVAVLLTALVLLTAAVTATWYRRKEEWRVWLYSRGVCLWALPERDEEPDKQFDAFVSYSYKDEGFVNDFLVPGLEAGNPPYRVCLHYRDWVPGEYIQDQILSSVTASHRTIVVLSPNFVGSMWGRLEFQAAHTQALKDRTNRLIVVVYGEVPKDLDGELDLYVKSNTYLKWGDPRFWERLRYAMPHVKRARKKPKKNQVDRLEPLRPYKLRDLESAKPCDGLEMRKPGDDLKPFAEVKTAPTYSNGGAVPVELV